MMQNKAQQAIKIDRLVDFEMSWALVFLTGR